VGVEMHDLFRKLREIRFRPYDTSTSQGRSAERLRRIALTAAASMLAKVISVVTSIATVPLTLNYLGPERYGIWMTMSSVISMLAFADLGIGNGVMNRVATAWGSSDQAEMRRILASGIVMLAGVSTVLAVIFAIAYPMVEWGRVFNVSSASALADVGPGMAVFVGIFALNIPAGIIQRTQNAMQEGFRNSLWQCVGSIGALVGVLVVIRNEGGLVWLVATFAGMPLIASLLAGAFFVRDHRELVPSLSDANFGRMRSLAHAGGAFFLLQLGASLAYATDNLVVAHQLGVAEVARYSVQQKLFNLIPLVVSMALLPLWPVYSEALARKDVDWAKKALSRFTVGAFVFSTVASLALVVLSPSLVHWWVGPTIDVSTYLSLGLAAWTIVDCTGRSVAMFLNGMNILWTQVWIVVSFVPLCVVLKIWLAGEFGSAGVPTGVALAYLTVHVPAYYLILKRWFSAHPAKLQQ